MGCHEAGSTTPDGDSDEYYIASVEEFKALKGIAPGSTIVWRDGQYDAVSISLKASGTEAAPIVLRAETPGGVVFTGMSSIQLSGAYLAAEGFEFKKLDTSVKGSVLTFAKESHDCRISDCKIDGSGSKATEVDTKWVSIYGTHNEVSGCSFVDKRNMGCLLVVWMEDGIVPEHKILNNYFSRPYTHYDEKGKALNGQESIRIGTSDYSMSVAGCTVRGNRFYRCNGERAEIISNKSCRNLYEGNLFEEGEGTLTLRHGNDCIVRGNYFLSGGKTEVGGVRIIGERHLVESNVFLNLTGSGYKAAICLVRGESDAALNGYWTVRDAVVSDNILIDCQYGIVVNYSGRDTQDSAPQGVKFSGNTIVSSKSYMIPVYVIDTPQGNISWQDNVIYGGKLKGIALDVTKTKPEVKDYSNEIANIRSKAGVRW